MHASPPPGEDVILPFSRQGRSELPAGPVTVEEVWPELRAIVVAMVDEKPRMLTPGLPPAARLPDCPTARQRRSGHRAV